MRMQVQLRLVLSEDNDQLQRYLDLIQTVDDSLPTTQDGGIVTLAASATQQVLFPKVTAGKYLVLVVLSGEVQYRVNNIGSQLLSIKPNPATTPDPILPYQKQAQPGLVFMGPIGISIPLTALWLVNPSTTVPARVLCGFVGEAA